MAVERFPVEASHILMFARAVDDPNPIYADAAYAASTGVGHIIAPPTFVQASALFDPNAGLRPKHGQVWVGSGKSPSGLMDLPKSDKASSGGGDKTANILHAEQHYEYHRHIGPGDVLTATTKPGKHWEKEGKKGGKLIFSESVTEYRDQNGELVITATGVGVVTERPAQQG